MRNVMMTAPLLALLSLLPVAAFATASAGASVGDPGLALRWLPAAPTGEEQAALPEVPEPPGAPVAPTKNAKPELWDAHRKAQAAYREARVEWKAAKAARSKVARSIKRAKARRLAADASVKKALAALRAQSTKAWPFAVAKEMPAIGGCDGQAACLLAAGKKAGSAWLLVISRAAAAEEARLKLLDLSAGKIASEASVPFGKKGRIDAAALAKTTRRLLGGARKIELARVLEAGTPLYTARNWSKAHALIARGLKLDARSATFRLWGGREAFDTGDGKKARQHLTLAAKSQQHAAEASELLGHLSGRQGKADEAARHFQRAIDGGRDSFDARLAVARVKLKKDPASASAHLTKALAERPEDGEVNLLQGRLLLAKKDRAAAAPHLKKALASGLAVGQMHFELGLLALEKKDSAGALKHLDAAHASGKSSGASLLAHGRMLAGKSPARAAELLARARRQGAKDPGLDLLLGQTALAAGQQRLAEQALLRATKQLASQGEAHLLLAKLYAGKADSATAARHFDAAAAGGHDSVEGRALLGEAALGRGDLAAAKLHFEAAVKQRPEDAELRFSLGSTLLRLGEHAAARKHLEKAAAGKVRPARTALLLARAVEKDDPKTALGHYRRAVELGSQDPAALRAVARSKSGPAAVPLWRRLLEALPGDGDASLALGVHAYEQGDPKTAIPLLKRAATFAEHQGRAQLLLGNLARTGGDLKGARAHYVKAQAAGAASVDLHEALGRAALEEGKRDEAIAHLSRVAKARPTDAELAFVLGEALAKAKRHPEARPYLSTALKLEDRKGQASLLLGRGYESDGELEKAAENYRRAQKFGVASRVADLGIAAAARKAGRSAEARAALERAVAMDGADGRARLDLGLLLLEQRELEGAAEHLGAAIRLKTEVQRARLALGKAREGLGQTDAALAAYQAVLKANPDSPEAVVRVGLLLAEQGQAKSARPLLEKSHKSRPDEVGVALALGRVRLATGDTKGARPLLEKALGAKASASDAEIFLSVARSAAREGRPAESNRFLAPVLVVKPGDAAALRLKGENHLELGESAAAVGAFRKALAASGDSEKPAARKKTASLRFDLGRALEAQGQREEAAKIFGESFADGGPIEGGIAHARYLKETRGAEAALAEAKAAVDRKPTPEGLRLLAALRHSSGDRDGAAAAWARLIALGEDDGEAHLYLAREALASGQRKTARQHLAAARDRHPDPGAVCALAGRLDFEARRWEAARTELACALERRSNDLRLAVMLAEAEVATKAWADAEHHLRSVLRRRPDHRRAHYLLARVQDSLGHDARALEHYRTFVKLSATDDATRSDLARIGSPLYRPLWSGRFDPDDSAGPTRTAAFLRMGRVYGQAGRHAEAARAYELALKASPGHFAANFALGIAHLEQRQSGAALEHLRDAVLSDPGHVEARAALAAALILQNQIPAAERMLQAVPPKARAKSLAARHNGALVLAMDGKYPAASKALEGLPGDTAEGNRMIVDLFAGRVQMAGERARRLLLTDPGHPEAAFVLARAQLEAKDAEAARSSLRRSVAAEPDFALARYELALLYTDVGLLEEARSALVRVTYLDPTFSEAHARLGVVYGELGHAAKELASYQKATELMAEETAARNAAEKRPRVAIASFKVMKANEELAWLKEGIAEALTTDLMQLGVVEVVERGRMDEVMKEVALGQMGVIDPETAVELGEQLGAEFLLLGSFVETKGKLTIDGRIVNAGEGTVEATARVAGKLDNLIALERRLALELVSQITTVRAAQRKAFLAQEKGSVGALKNAALGRQMLFAGRPEEAKAYLRKAMAEDPRYAAAATSMQAAWGQVSQAIAILPLKNLSGAAEHDWLSTGISESLTTDLRQVAGIFLVERMQIDKTMNEMALGQFFDIDEAPEVGRTMGAGLLLIGSYQVVAGRLQIDSRLIDTTTGQVLLAEKVSGLEKDLFDLERILASKIVDTLQVDLTDEERRALAEGKPSVDDFKRLLQSQSTLAVASQPKPVRRVLVAEFQGMKNTKPAPGLAKKCQEFFHAALISNGLPAVVAEEDRAKAKEEAEQRVAEWKAKQGEGASTATAPIPEIEMGKVSLADSVLVGRCQIREGRLKLEVRAIAVESGAVRVAVGSDARLKDSAEMKRGVFEELLRGLGVIRKLSDHDILALAGQDHSESSEIMGAVAIAGPGWKRRARWSVYGSGGAAVVAGGLLLTASHYFTTAQEAAALRNASRSSAAFEHYDTQAHALQSTGDGLLIGGVAVGAAAVGLASYAAWNLMTEEGDGLDTAPAVTVGVIPTKGGAAASLSLQLW